MSGPAKMSDLTDAWLAPAGSPVPAVRTTHLTKRYRRATALSDCSVTVP